MPKFIITRTVGKLTDAQIAEATQRAMEALAHLPNVKWIRTYYLADEGKMYCEYEAPNMELIYEHARLAKIPADSVSMVRELQPAMFR
ncbi:MAG: DUF4242 domain-containing protein [Nitrospirae bacterium]|nr:DUF4242 domain-containing protein [Nitrospirota bacterium]